MAEPLDTPAARFFVAPSLHGGISEAAVDLVARWTGAEATCARPLPRDRPGLVLTARGLRLHAPGVAPVWWHAGFAPRRCTRGGREALLRAMGLRDGETVLDATLGLGHDALVLASAGARVLAWERLAPVLVFTACGLATEPRGVARRITFRHVDHTAGLPAFPSNGVDHVFLDPMFPTALAGPSASLAPLRACAESGRPTPDLLAHARRVARRRVVLRLAHGEPVPDGAIIARSKRVRYAVWHTHGACGKRPR